jgi:hypothetical protein
MNAIKFAKTFHAIILTLESAWENLSASFI